MLLRFTFHGSHFTVLSSPHIELTDGQDDGLQQIDVGRERGHEHGGLGEFIHGHHRLGVLPLGARLPALDEGVAGVEAAADDAVVPAFEGRDLGALRLEIERSIPTVGRMPVYNASVEASAEPRLAELEMLATRLGVRPESYDGKWTYQLGSLGGGNHFIELVTDRPPVAVRLAGRDDYRVRVGNYRVVYAIDDEAVRAGGAVRMASGGVPAGARTRTRIRAFLWRHLPAQRGRSTPAEVANDDNARDLSRRLSQSRQPAASRMHPP